MDVRGVKARTIGLRAAVFSVVIFLSIAALGCCRGTTVVLGPAHQLPPPSAISLPVPAMVNAPSDSITLASMKNVAFHVDDEAVLDIHYLRGAARDLRGQHIILLDDKNTLEIQMNDAEVALTARNLSIILNRYIFGYKGSQLHNLNVKTEGDHIVMTGTLHKIIDIPFEITASMMPSPDGWIHIHPSKIRICTLNGEALLKAVGSSLEKMIDLKGARGVRVKDNDLFVDPLLSLPAPKIIGHLRAIRVQGDGLVMSFGDPDGLPDTAPPVAAPNYIYFRGGTVQFGKLYMVRTDLEVVDGDPGDPFEFYLDYYNSQLVAGYHVTLPNFALVAYMPDFSDLGTAKGRIRP